ncbi:MAG: hypothetical protein M0Z65_10755 [Firmicutes bacterium]|uniref:DPH-type MB domain-containing protein n=1 Tax=Kroppenstedtia guangzhouensis TaxID=1274356 RepID=A0ABQ1GN46_9BACL|nr:hypothetical protein [Kroppenstedtia guangzhouensis]EGK10207.1 NrdR family transcriptional regulator [Desmospora sp. 8437]MDA8353637.1 hypothetical protein [Bacillota bacterium]GGA46948.1 hypothetical protein GCM10007416_20160 [Kroppenstedtia guangzhouensis]
MDLECTDFPICPHCGTVEKDYLEIMDETTGDGDEIEYECWACGGSVTVEIHMSLNFSTRA